MYFPNIRFLKSSGLKESKSLVMDFTKYAELKLSITCVALSTAAEEGSYQAKMLVLGEYIHLNVENP